MKTSKLFLLLSLVLFAINAFAQKTWEKPYQKWSKEDVIKILNNSPWVETYQSTEGNAAIAKQQAIEDQNSIRIKGQPQVTGSTQRTLSAGSSVMRLHSALPIRQALIRNQQLEAGYDKMDEKKRAEFDSAMKNILECPICQNYYVVTLTKPVNASGQDVEDGLFQTLKLDQLKGNVWLQNDKGEKIELTQFTPPKGAKDFAVLFFARDKNNSFLTPNSKTLKVIFNGEFLTNNNPYAKFLPRSFEFNVSKMMIGDAIVF